LLKITTFILTDLPELGTILLTFSFMEDWRGNIQSAMVFRYGRLCFMEDARARTNGVWFVCAFAK